MPIVAIFVPELAETNPCEITRRLCAILNVHALISDESLDPYSMRLVDQAGKTRRVSLDVESLDQREEYRISNDAPSND